MKAYIYANRGCNIKSPFSDSPVAFSGEIWNKIREHNLFDNSHTICLHARENIRHVDKFALPNFPFSAPASRGCYQRGGKKKKGGDPKIN